MFDDSFEAAAASQEVRYRQMGLSGLCPTCRQCGFVTACGGRYLPHRYAEGRGFDNPSVYCADLMRIIGHIASTVSSELRLDTTAP